MDLKDKRIIVTGGAGFLGTHVVKRLRQLGVIDLFIPRSNEYNLTKDNDVDKMLNHFPADIIIHLAAVVGGIGANQKNPGTYFYQNIMMGTKLMEHARIHGVHKFVSIGTVCSYPKYCRVPFHEEDIWSGYPEETNAPYGLAKKMMLVQSKAYREQFGFNSINLIPGNLYGPGDNFHPDSSHVIPALIRKCIQAVNDNKKEIVVWGDGSASREFLYVEDAAEGIILGTMHYNRSEPVNLGTGIEVKIQDLVSIIAEITQYKGQIIWDTSKPNGQPRRCLDITKAKGEFGFTSKTELQKGLKKTIDWYRTTLLD